MRDQKNLACNLALCWWAKQGILEEANDRQGTRSPQQIEGKSRKANLEEGHRWAGV